jgi:hypothetical protein
VKERLREFYSESEPDAARRMLEGLVEHCGRSSMPAQVQKLGRTLRSWFDKICNYPWPRCQMVLPKRSTT